MTGRSMLGAIGAILGLVALVAGIADWTLNIQVIPMLETDVDFLYAMADFVWIVWVLAVGGSLITIGIATALPEKSKPVPVTEAPDLPPARRTVAAVAPPPIPTAAPVATPPEESRAAADLWQSADAPFPAPPSIEHPSAGPDLWQSDKDPFPKVDVPEEDDESGAQEPSAATSEQTAEQSPVKPEPASEDDAKAAERARWGK
ncbi:MAG: hypothetical protein ACQKBV_02005 [Puniceicoccales bacterium]